MYLSFVTVTLPLHDRYTAHGRYRYESNVNLSSVSDPHEAARLKAQINNFGQMPQQLLHSPHPQRRPRTPQPWPCAAAGGAPSAVVSELTLDSVPVTVHALEEAVLVFDR